MYLSMSIMHVFPDFQLAKPSIKPTQSLQKVFNWDCSELLALIVCHSFSVNCRLMLWKNSGMDLEPTEKKRRSNLVFKSKGQLCISQSPVPCGQVFFHNLQSSFSMFSVHLLLLFLMSESFILLHNRKSLIKQENYNL